MFKQCVAVILLSFSAILMVGHDVIPHYHDENNEHHHAMHHRADSHHSHTNQHHSDSNDSSNKNSGIGDLLSYFVHTGDFAIQESSIRYSIDIDTENSDTPILQVADYISNNPTTDSKSCGYNYIGPFYIPPHSNSKGLRAPPVFFS